MSIQPQKNATLEKAVQERRLYQKQWRENNREKIKATQLRYWAKRAAQREQAEKDGGKNGT